MIGALMDRRLTVIHRGEVGRDRLDKPLFGETGRSEGVPGRLETSGSTEGQEYVSGLWTAYLAASVDISSADLVTDGSQTWAVDGLPERRSIPGFPALDHVVVRLRALGGTA